MTLEEFVTKYAPPSENDTEAYIKHMIKQLSVNRDDKFEDVVNTAGLDAVAAAISMKEDNTMYEQYIKPLLSK